MSTDISKELQGKFEGVVYYQVGKNYKGGLFAKQRLRWKMTKVWNSRWLKIGIPGDVRRELGEQDATRLFQDTVDKIVNNPTRLQMAIQEARTQDMFNQID